jgi:hypothetical protein
MFGMALALVLFAQAAPARPGIVSGQLRTVEGSPAVSFRVAAIAAPSATVRPSFGSQYYYADTPVSTALTDNQGRYRLVNVPPGRYFIVSGTTYFPSTLDPDAATVVTVTPDSTTPNLDFKLLTEFGGKVSGVVKPKPAGNEKAILSGVDFDGLLEVPIAPDGSFEFGHVPTGDYVIDIVPTPPGMAAFRVKVGVGDVTGLELVRPATHAVTGRIVVQNGPLPRAHLAFYTDHSYVGGRINPDGTFSAQLHASRHWVELAGMPGGYSIVSVRAGSEDASRGLVVGNSDLSGVVITVSAPRQLPRVRGRISGLPEARLSSARVQLTGPIVGALETAVRPDGSFEYPAVTPGMYTLRLAQVPELPPMNLVVSWSDADVQVAVPNR